MSFRDHARAQAAACEELGSAYTARILRLVADHLRPGHAVADRLLGWPGERLDNDAVALRLAGALHYLVLTRQAAILARFYGRSDIDDPQLWRSLDAVLRLKAAAIMPVLENAPQTNEVARSAVFIAAGHWLTAAFGLPLVLSELGCAAGLNLIWDHYALQIGDQRLGPEDATLTLSPDWRGAVPPVAAPVIRARAGVDRNPLDPVADRDRLQSYIWVDQPARLARQATALDLAAELQPPVREGCAVAWLSDRLSRPQPQACHMVYHSLFWQYLTDAQQREIIDTMARTRLQPNEPLAHVAMEDDGEGPGARLTLTLWPQGTEIALGRADFHGAWVDWQAPDPQAWTARRG
ncbi:DUF2332 domain-containing protein [Roseibaca sp. Y0-43]|uniref:DUF2332 domain-containing protein n=1 Tax=Roseibaca sp. Y0-43 TaxID=2816854 RepID=UPI001D0CC547|nr:DUF2332 family protein [Roseibaca sp. Y0-43]MCC1480305.1 DUF2332 family protein [Roseibaca sp. Y0-43]